MATTVPAITPVLNRTKDDFIRFIKNFGYAPTYAELYKTEDEKEAARKKMFDSMDLKCTGVITFEEWVKFSMDHIISKVR